MYKDYIEYDLKNMHERIETIINAINDDATALRNIKIISYHYSNLIQMNRHQAREIYLLTKQKLKLQQVISKRDRQMEVDRDRWQRKAQMLATWCAELRFKSGVDNDNNIDRHAKKVLNFADEMFKATKEII